MVATTASGLAIDIPSVAEVGEGITCARVGQAARLSSPDEVQAQASLPSDRRLAKIKNGYGAPWKSGYSLTILAVGVEFAMRWNGENPKLAEPQPSSGSEK
jgi:hypothetical protein